MKALKFYSSLRIETRKKGGSTIKEKIGAEQVPVGHTIACTVQKNKTAPPFRKAEYTVYYDGRKVSQTEELLNAVLSLGLIPKYDSSGNLSETGRTYKYSYDGEELVAKKQNLLEELEKCPKIQAHLLELIKSGDYTTETHTQAELQSEMDDEEFERQIEEDVQAIKNGESLVDEIEDPSADWDNF